MIRLRRAVVLGFVAVAAACAAPVAPGDPVVRDGAGQTLAVTPLQPPTTSAGQASWTPWPSVQHDARHSGASSTDGPTTGHVRWRRTFPGGITQGAVVGADGTVYAASDAGILHALDPATGADRWTYDSGRSGGGDLSTSPLVLPDGSLLWGPGDHDLVALSPTGALRWVEHLGGRPTSPVTTDGRRVYVGDTGGGVTALDLTPGGGHRRAWTLSVGPSSYGSVVTDGAGRLYTTSGSGLVAVDDLGSAGTVAWTADPKDTISEVSAGLGPDGTALLGTNGTAEWAYHRDGSPAWHAGRVITYSSPGVTDDGLAYVADHSGRVQVLTVATGEVRATYQLAPPQQIWTAVAVDRAHRLYFATLNGHVMGAAADGSLLFDVDLGSSIYAYPALTGDGALLVGSRDGELVAIGT